MASVVSAMLAIGCARAPSVLRPASEPASRLSTLGWWLLAISCVVTLVIIVLVLVPVFRRRALPGEMNLSSGGGTTPIVVGVAISAAIIVGVFLYTIVTLGQVATPSEKPGVVMEVVGHRWWWEVHYLDARPSQSVVTANEIHIPVGEPVELRVQSADVIHSFWVPQLNGKVDVVPGQTNVFWIRADEPGTYHGQCAEYCGAQHANMMLTVYAEPPAQFTRWLGAQRRPAATPTDEFARRGEQEFLQAPCSLCHAIRGTPAGGKLGPDLTHLASRSTIAAGMLPNRAGQLTGWISDAPSLKPGTLMPRMELAPSELHDIVAYLSTLR